MLSIWLTWLLADVSHDLGHPCSRQRFLRNISYDWIQDFGGINTNIVPIKFQDGISVDTLIYTEYKH